MPFEDPNNPNIEMKRYEGESYEEWLDRINLMLLMKEKQAERDRNFGRNMPSGGGAGAGPAGEPSAGVVPAAGAAAAGATDKDGWLKRFLKGAVPFIGPAIAGATGAFDKSGNQKALEEAARRRVEIENQELERTFQLRQFLEGMVREAMANGLSEEQALSQVFQFPESAGGPELDKDYLARIQQGAFQNANYEKLQNLAGGTGFGSGGLSGLVSATSADQGRRQLIGNLGSSIAYQLLFGSDATEVDPGPGAIGGSGGNTFGHPGRFTGYGG